MSKDRKVIPLISKGRKLLSNDGPIDDHGMIGNLKYEVYRRGVIHIFDDRGHKFKKNSEAFEDVMDEIQSIIEDLQEGQNHTILGSGDNDHLVFTRKNGDIDLSLKKRTFETIEKLRSIISKGKKKEAVA